ncbi:MAG: endonuclease/exonuclease/phosphatase family protein [Halocynthiibacter sp.]
MVRLIAILAGLWLCLSYFGGVHPLADSLAVFRPVMAGILVFAGCLELLGRKWMGLGMVALAAFAFLPRDGGEMPATPTHVHYQKNLLFLMTNPSRIVDDIAETGAQSISFQEVSKYNGSILERLKPEFPSQHFCNFATVGGTAVLSKYPVIEGTQTCADRDGLAAMQVQTKTGPVWIVSIHLHWPYPYGQAAQVTRLIPILEGLKGAKIIGGDFNAVPHTHAISALADAANARWISGGGHSFRLPKIKMGVRIDHVLISDAFTGATRTRKRLGSDHKGVAAYLLRQP